MHRRSAVGQLAAAVAGLSLGEMPDLGARAPGSSEPFSVTEANLAESTGLVTCPRCEEMWDALKLTPAGVCLVCADRDPTLRVRPHSDPFWTLSPQEIGRLEREIERLSSRLDQIDARLTRLQRRRMEEASDVYDRAIEADLKQWHERGRELHLLHLLRAASRQFARHQ